MKDGDERVRRVRGLVCSVFFCSQNTPLFLPTFFLLFTFPFFPVSLLNVKVSRCVWTLKDEKKYVWQKQSLSLTLSHSLSLSLTLSVRLGHGGWKLKGGNAIYMGWWCKNRKWSPSIFALNSVTYLFFPLLHFTFSSFLLALIFLIVFLQAFLISF